MGGNNRLFLIVGGGVLAVIAVVVATLYFVGGAGTPLGGGFLARLQNGLTAVTGSMTPAQMAQAPDFAFRRLEIDTSKPQAEACLVFTRSLDASGRTHYEDYFSIDPVTRVAAHVVDDRLCLSGLEFNKTYNVTLKERPARRDRREIGVRRNRSRGIARQAFTGSLRRWRHPAA